jgi:hypothetical protein
MPLDTRSRLMFLRLLKFVLTLRMMLPAPLQSALIYQLLVKTCFARFHEARMARLPRHVECRPPT